MCVCVLTLPAYGCDIVVAKVDHAKLVQLRERVLGNGLDLVEGDIEQLDPLLELHWDLREVCELVVRGVEVKRIAEFIKCIWINVLYAVVRYVWRVTVRI